MTSDNSHVRNRAQSLSFVGKWSYAKVESAKKKGTGSPPRVNEYIYIAIKLRFGRADNSLFGCITLYKKARPNIKSDTHFQQR